MGLGMLKILRCPWSRRRLDRYLDDDPAAPLSQRERRRLESHLAVCQWCTRTLEGHRLVRRVLAAAAADSTPDAGAVRRLQLLLDDLGAGATGR